MAGHASQSAKEAAQSAFAARRDTSGWGAIGFRGCYFSLGGARSRATRMGGAPFERVRLM